MIGSHWNVMRVAAASPKKEEVKLPFHTKLATGAVAGIIGTMAVFPIDIVKTRLQNQKIENGVARYRNPIHCFTTILREEGPRGLYRGLGANLVGVSPEKAIKLAVNDFMREFLTTEDGELSIPRQILAGATAGTCQVVATNPMELVKINMQMQASTGGPQLSTLEVVRKLGLRGVYRGSFATFVRDIPYSIILFPSYGIMKEAFADKDGETSLPRIVAAGGLAGGLAGAMVTPQDVVKTRLQTAGVQDQYTGVVNCFQTIIREEGVGALYKGVLNRFAVQFPLFGIALCAFEFQKKKLEEMGSE